MAMFNFNFSLPFTSLLLVFLISQSITDAETDSTRIPLFITPLKFLPQPLDTTSPIFYSETKRNSFFSKVTVWDVWQNTNLSISHFRNSTVYDVLVMANRLYQDLVLKPGDLYSFKCTFYCYILEFDDISFVTNHDSSFLNGKTSNPITLGQLHDAVVKTLENIFCFRMKHIEQRLFMSSFSITEYEWMLFVHEISWYAIKCRADILVITPSELAELVRTNESVLLGYNLEMLKSDLIEVYENVIEKRHVFETREMSKIVDTDDNSDKWTIFSMFHYISSVTNFTIRDLEILYDWNPSQLHALEFISLQSYNSCQGIYLDRTMYNISQMILASKYASSNCPISVALSRSIDYVQNFKQDIGNVFNESVLGIFTKVTGISSWFKIADILKLDYEDGIYVDTPRIREIMKYQNVSKGHIELLSVHQIINKYLSSKVVKILVKNYQPIFYKMISTYGFSVRELLTETGLSRDELNEETIPSAHRFLLDTVIERYQIDDFTFMVNYSGHAGFDLNFTTTLPSSEWSRIVSTAIQQSFHQTMIAFSYNLQHTPDAIKIISQLGGFQSISTTNQPSSNDDNVAQLVSCLFQRTVSSVHTMSFAQYHKFYNNTLVSLIKKKIHFETTSLSSILAQRGILLEDIDDESVLSTINIGVGLSGHEIKCLYGQPTLSVLNNGITWKDVRETRLCSSFVDHSLLKLILDLKNAPVVQCGNDGCSSSPCHADAHCLDNGGSGVTCECKTGFEGDGNVCTDKNECQPSSCHEYATCKNTIGSYQCTCKNGFNGNGKSCTDKDECLTSPCHTKAMCQNIIGSYTCSCQNGFTGDGKSCKDAGQGSSSSSNSDPIVIVGSVVGGMLFLVVVVLLVAFCLYRRNSLKRDRKKRNQEQRHHHNIENAAYEPGPGLRRPPVPDSNDGYETPGDYAELDNSRRVPLDNNYQGLIKFNKNNSQSNSNPETDYTQLSKERDEDDAGYTSLNLGNQTGPPATTSDASHSVNQASKEPIYEELP